MSKQPKFIFMEENENFNFSEEKYFLKRYYTPIKLN